MTPVTAKYPVSLPRQHQARNGGKWVCLGQTRRRLLTGVVHSCGLPGGCGSAPGPAGWPGRAHSTPLADTFCSRRRSGSAQFWRSRSPNPPHLCCPACAHRAPFSPVLLAELSSAHANRHWDFVFGLWHTLWRPAVLQSRRWAVRVCWLAVLCDRRAGHFHNGGCLS